MKYIGYGRRFSTINDQQFDEIGKFWDEMSSIYGRENLIGFCCDWYNNSLMYYIGLKDNTNMTPISTLEYINITLPDEGWESYFGYTEKIDALYKNLICKGTNTPIVFELEELNNDGTCLIRVYRGE